MNDVKPRKAVENILTGGVEKTVPFTMYESKIPQCEVERKMRNRGLCIVYRNIPILKSYRPNVKTTESSYWKDGKKFTRIEHETPVGTLSVLEEYAGFTMWVHEKMFKSPDDYKALLFLMQDEVFESSYGALTQAMNDTGDDIIFRTSFGLEPLQTLISGHAMGMETFCMEWMDNRDEILKIYDVITEKRREIYPIVAESPVLHANYGGNVTPEIIGLETFEKYYVQHYNEAAEVMHKNGKLIGCHFDANCRLLSKAIAGSDLDYIEAFTPAPDTDMTLKEARDAWPDKVIWMNFPSSVHLSSDETIIDTTLNMLGELDSTDGIIMGITEDIPLNRWQKSCTAIMDGLEKFSG